MSIKLVAQALQRQLLYNVGRALHARGDFLREAFGLHGAGVSPHVRADHALATAGWSLLQELHGPTAARLRNYFGSFPVASDSAMAQPNTMSR